MVLHLAKVAPGITIRSGIAVNSGAFIQTQAEADDPSLGKVTSVTAGQRTFMEDVLHVNVQLAEGYDQLYFQGGILALLGINLNPATDFNPVESLPTLGSSGSEAVTSFRNRIIGNVTLANSLAQLNLVMGNRDSIRADEGSPFVFGTISQISDNFTAHALEGTGIVAGDNNQFGFHSIIHGGEDTSTGSTTLGTTLGSNIIVGDWSVVFRSTIQDGVTLGSYCFIDNTLITAGTVIPDRAIYIDNVFLGFVEW
jgi:carbonic anhydrase/acetyltransferase-like protein (isoleucine patch superfamily)